MDGDEPVPPTGTADTEAADPAGPGPEAGTDPAAVSPGSGTAGPGPDDPPPEASDQWFVDGYDDLFEEGPRPPVVAVVVVRDPGAWFEEALASLAGLDYPELSILVIDDGSAEDPTPRIAAVAPAAFVRRRETAGGFASAANDVIATVQGAPFLLFVHGDAVLDPNALTVLVDEAVRSNAGIVGPKVVRHDDVAALLEVGMTVDRLGAPHTMIEPGEIDQEQHDAVRDVFWISGVTMLVRADLFAEIGGFDADAAPGAEDVDLGWRARIAGARIMVAPDARVRHHLEDSLRDALDAPEVEVEAARHRAMLTSAGAASLAWVVPFAVLLAVLEAVAALLTGHRRRAGSVLGGWWRALRGVPAARAARRAAQSHRRVHDGDLRYLQSRGSSRVRRFMNGTLHADDRLRGLSAAGRTITDVAAERVREPVGIAVIVFTVLVAIGSRGLLLGTVPQVGQFRVWPGVGDALTTFTSGWRDSLLGASTQQPPLLVVVSGLGTLLLGATGLARTLLIVAAMPVGVLAAWRLGRAVAGPGSAAVVTGLAYGVLPLPRNAIAAGRIGPLVAYAVAPAIVLGVARLAGLLEVPRRGRRRLVAVAALTAFAAVWWPPALLLPLVVALAVAIASPFTRAGGAGPAWRPAALTSLGALALLLPWPLVLLGLHDGATLGFAYSGHLRVIDILRLHTGPAGAGPAIWVLLGVAFIVLLVASGPRFVWAVRAWALMVIGYAAAWLPGRFAPGWSVPVREGLLVPAAVGLALAVGLGAAAFAADLGRRGFGWRQVAVVVAAGSLVIPALAFAADTLGGRWGAPSNTWADELSWMEGRASAGDFRVLWLGDATILPLDPGRRGAVAYGVTANGTGDARVLVPTPARGVQARIAEAVDALRARSTNRIGAMVGPMGFRFIAVPETPGPDQRPLRPAPDDLTGTLADQLDLVRLETRDGLTLYEVEPWRPVRAVLPADGGPPVPARADARNPAGRVTLAVPASGAWRARGGTPATALERARVDGWANGYRLPSPGPVRFDFAWQWLRWPAVALQLGVLVGAVLLWRSDRPRRARVVADGPIAGAGDREDGAPVPGAVRAGDVAEPRSGA
ncbi:MAG: glycosyltransferase [Actinomycetes bacterium]